MSDPAQPFNVDLKQAEDLKRLQSLATTRLEPDAAQRGALLEQVVHYAEAFLEGLPSAPVYLTDQDRGQALYASPVAEEPANVAELLALLKCGVDRPGINAAAPGFMGYIPGGGLDYSALGDFLAAVANRYAGVLYASPGAVRIERILIDWLAQIAGYGSSAEGDLTSGGSIANLIGIVTARDAHQVRPRDVEAAVVYLSEQTHHSVDKARRWYATGGDCRSPSTTRHTTCRTRGRCETKCPQPTSRPN